MYARFCKPILARARTMPIVRTIRPPGAFCCAPNTIPADPSSPLRIKISRIRLAQVGRSSYFSRCPLKRPWGKSRSRTPTPRCRVSHVGFWHSHASEEGSIEAIRRIMTVCRRGRMAAGAIGDISENAPTGLNPTYEAEEPSALRLFAARFREVHIDRCTSAPRRRRYSAGGSLMTSLLLRGRRPTSGATPVPATYEWPEGQGPGLR